MKRIAIPLQSFNGSGPNIVVAMPLYKQLPVTWYYNWLRMEKARCTGLVSTDGVYLPIAMDAIVKTALDKFPQWEWLVVYEHDMLPPLDAFNRIAQYHDKDIVGALYFMHEPPHKVMAWTLGEDGIYQALPSDDVRNMATTPGLYEVHAVAMGFTAINRRVLENWDDTPMWTPTTQMPGHDIHFCHQARRQGFSIWLDTGLRCGHITEAITTYADSEAAIGSS